MEPPSVPDIEKTFDELYVRIDATIAELETVEPERVNGGEETEVRNKYIPGQHFLGFGYVTEYVIPNFYFHVTTAYGILRHLGVPIGKGDYMGTLPLIDDAK